MTSTDATKIQRHARLAHDVLDALDRAVPGQRGAAEVLLAGYLSGGHVLLEGVPGIGKTVLARCLAACLGLDFSRVQFTPDLMPSDVTGMNVFDAGARTFHLVRGPIFTSVLLADEINRTPPKTQAALLEAMQESQVTIDGQSHALDPAFFVVATQNPVEFEGTYPLPEAQLDRFRVRVAMASPNADAQVEIYRRAIAGTLTGWGEAALPAPAMEPAQAAALRQATQAIHAAEGVLVYLAQLVQAIGASPHTELGISPRGGLALLETARAAALFEERDFVVPDDIKRFLVPCWSHRLI
ncbi:MAG TPA: AAA family ATPase, partial [Candidatus Krumholzibacteria bacterium]